MTADEALAAFAFAEGLAERMAEELAGRPLDPAERQWVGDRAAEFVSPRLDPDAWARVKFHELLSDLASGRAIVVSGEDGSTSVEW